MDGGVVLVDEVQAAERLAVQEDLMTARDGLCAGLRALDLAPFVSTDWGALERLNAQHRDSWFELLPRPASAACLWAGVTDSAGDVVAVQASILLDCAGRSYGARLEDLTSFYDAPAPADAWCFSASPEAREARGRVAMMSSGWVRPDLRGGNRDLFHQLGRLNRLAVLTRWCPDWLVALIDPPVSRLWTVRAVGERHLDRHPTVLFHQPGEGRLRLHVLRFRPEAVAADLQRRAS
ncbi:hypothetical protein [Azospirillum sp. SYSU D00513]|uniref:hypothetical protein n=1 Tax=Azospirillum sp. SYSU D00513 TaxID=2812561 RepID=UPI001A956750|nr:hypothetical protein [Azospirillum sp. SYSU D00513]